MNTIQAMPMSSTHTKFREVEVIAEPSDKPKCWCHQHRRVIAIKNLPCTVGTYQVRYPNWYCESCETFPTLTETVILGYGYSLLCDQIDELSADCVKLMFDTLVGDSSAKTIATHTGLSVTQATLYRKHGTGSAGGHKGKLVAAVLKIARIHHTRRCEVAVVPTDVQVECIHPESTTRPTTEGNYEFHRSNKIGSERPTCDCAGRSRE